MGLSTSIDVAGGGGDAVAHAGRGGDQVDAEFALQPLLHDLHVQQAQKSAAETEAQRHGIFRLVEKRRVVQLQFAEGVAQIFVVARQHGKQAREHHGLDRFKSGQRRRGPRGIDDGVAHARIGHLLDVGDDEADVAGDEFLEHHGLGRQRAERFDFVHLVVEAQANFHVLRDSPVHHAHQHHRAAKRIEPRIENQRLQRRFRRAGRRRDARHDGFQHDLHAEAAFGADQQRVGGGNRQHIFDLLFRLLGLRRGQIDLVDDGNDREIVLRREKRVGDGLRLDALARVHHQQRAFARGKRARNFVGKIDVARRVDQVELVFVAVLGCVVQADALGLDGDAALALEVHRVQHLRAHLALAERAGQLEQAVGQRGLAVVNMRDDAKIADETWVHQLACRRASCKLSRAQEKPVRR